MTVRERGVVGHGGTVRTTRIADRQRSILGSPPGQTTRHLDVTVAFLVTCLLLLRLSPVESTAPSPVSASKMIAITPDGAALLVVNPDSNTLSVVDTSTHLVIEEVGVGIDPRAVALSPAGETAYVVSQGSGALTVIDLATLGVQTLPMADRPVGVAVSPGGGLIAVSELGDDQVRLLDAGTLDLVALVPVADRPYGLTFTPDGTRLLVSHLHSGEVTVLSVLRQALYLPLVVRNATAPWSVAAPRTAAAASPGLGVEALQTSIATWSNVGPAPAVVVNAAGTRAYLPQTMANGLGLNTGFDTSVFPKVSVLNLETWSHQTSEHISLPEVDRPVGLPWDVALARGDTELWVVNAASNDVSIVNITNPSHPSRAAHIQVGDNPRSIVFSPNGRIAYVNNILAGTVSVIDTDAYTVTGVITVTDLPLPPTLLHGKRLFHSSATPSLARAGWISCNTCHIEGEHDGRTWLLQYTGDVPPGAAAVITRNTTSLLGMIETYPLRWSAEWDESADSEFSVRFEQFGTGLIDGDMHPTLGALNQGRSYDLDCLASFIDSLSAPSGSHTLNLSEQDGKAIFESPESRCAECHPAPLYTDFQVHDVGTASSSGEWFGPLIDTPSLRFLYDSAPYLHNGSASTLLEVLTADNPDDEHGVTSHLTEQELEALVAFLSALPLEE